MIRGCRNCAWPIASIISKWRAERMVVRMACCVVVGIAMSAASGARADCAQEISRLMSKDTEKLTTRFNRIIKQVQHKASPKLIAEECKIARQLQPRLEDQIAALKQSDCSKDPQMATMVADIMRGHEDDLAAARRSATRCR
jgi:hypothetical protein